MAYPDRALDPDDALVPRWDDFQAARGRFLRVAAPGSRTPETPGSVEEGGRS